jgi:8-oxo-dGTP pyrophosphatase MutT (NUDIX family)
MTGVPEWLRGLAAAAPQMTVPPALRPPPGSGRPSAVLVLFGDGPDGPDLLLVQRGPWLRRHAGQPAFPGGAIEESDGGPVPAALR